ncbi:hypothetical protein TWF102_005184 [Orbilia oligospora]|uniref:Uncharacterized protein n=1 Tax=Orbilia oligospora TaxID=2813651 RepID=A0A7C8NGY6_ORBOL|nr:hypothetical protein TWF102_005184 [Orbilia oligospora]KAF3111808.1 hypothetical protein TWF706_011538 [Orbilia oligospora]KAF3126863.1 hypothetical protein TWF594_000818 [Orbilia oligospora]KAF3140925.1 hypothetical protein TWF703_002429 [Orbilia oligospora]
MHALYLSLLLPTTVLASFNLLSLPESAGSLPDVPSGTTPNPSCIAAYNATIDCDSSVVTNSFGDSQRPTAAELDKICTSTCLTSLRKWVRGGEGCEGETFLNYFGLLSEKFFDEDVGRNATATDVWQYYITAAYHTKCLVDFSSKTYCLLAPETPGYTQPGLLNTSNPDALCKENTCATQSAYLFSPIKTIYKYDPTNITESRDREESNGDLPMLTLEEACPDIDTSEYPLREEDVTAEMLKSGSTGGNGNNNGGATKDGDKPGAAVGMNIDSRNLMAAVVVGFVGLLAL